MSFIQIDNSFSKLHGFTTKLVNLVAEALTYTNEEAILEAVQVSKNLQYAIYRRNRKLVWFFKKRLEELEAQKKVCLLKEDSSFPTGLVPVVVEALMKAGCRFEVKDLRERPKSGLGLPWKLGGDLALRYYQKEMVEAGIDAGRGVFVSCVGSGKTLVMLKLIKDLDVPTLVITPSSDLKEQTYNSFVECFGTKYVEKISATSGKTNKLKLNFFIFKYKKRG